MTADAWWWSTALLVPLLPVVLFLLLRRAEGSAAASEPPLLRSPIPLLGHVLGIIRNGPRYFSQTSNLISAPIYSLPVPLSRIHVVADPALASQVFRNSKALTFGVFIAEIGCRMCGVSAQARRIIERNLDGSQGKDGYAIEIHDLTIKALTPSPELNRISLAMLRDAWSDHLAPLPTSSRVRLYDFLTSLFTDSSTTALYGSASPFRKDPSLGAAFWAFANNVNPLVFALPWPSITARKAYHARDRLARAFAAYFAADPRGSSSSVAEARYNIATKHGLSFLDTGRLELGIVIGALANTVPAAFWMILRIYMDPKLLAALRAEITAHALAADDDSSTILIPALRSACPLLHATLQETLRLHSDFAAVRYVASPVQLGAHTLRKGSIVQIPNSVMHTLPALWGPDSASFDPSRFAAHKLDAAGRYNIDPASWTTSGPSAGAYRPFGGGVTLCPGRHFAAMEVLGVVAVVVLSFDMRPAAAAAAAAEGGEWGVPGRRYNSVVEGVLPPDGDVEVHVERVRRGEWRFAI